MDAIAPIRNPKTNTASGKRFPLVDPSPEDVDWHDMAEHLAKEPRFIGAGRGTYSIAQHSIVVAEILPVEARPYGLVHDGKEYVIGDIITPVKEALILYGAGDALDRVEAPIDAAIHRAAGLEWPVPPIIAYMVKRADLVALATEIRDLMPDGLEWDVDLPPPLNRTITPWPWHRAMDAYMDRLRRWLPVPVA